MEKLVLERVLRGWNLPVTHLSLDTTSGGWVGEVGTASKWVAGLGPGAEFKPIPAIGCLRL
jgi:hypothetical protein